jgi:hypothetical protein
MNATKACVYISKNRGRPQMTQNKIQQSQYGRHVKMVFVFHAQDATTTSTALFTQSVTEFIASFKTVQLLLVSLLSNAVQAVFVFQTKSVTQTKTAKKMKSV